MVGKRSDDLEPYSWPTCKLQASPEEPITGGILGLPVSIPYIRSGQNFTRRVLDLQPLPVRGKYVRAHIHPTSTRVNDTKKPYIPDRTYLFDK